MHTHESVGPDQNGARLPDAEQPLHRTPAPRAKRPDAKPPLTERAAPQPETTENVTHYGAGF